MINIDALLEKRADLLDAYETAECWKDSELMAAISKEIEEIQVLIEIEKGLSSQPT